MNKLFSLFLIGIFISYIIDFFFLLGLKINYLEYHNIKTYYNIFFADNQNISIFLLSSFFIGSLFVFFSKPSFGIIVSVLLFLGASSTFIPSIGLSVGYRFLAKKDIFYKQYGQVYKGDLIYNDRGKLYVFDRSKKDTIVVSKIFKEF